MLTIMDEIPMDHDALIEARLGDLDVKSEAKLESWTALEKSLIDEGWYTDNFSYMERLGPCVLEDLAAREMVIRKSMTT